MPNNLSDIHQSYPNNVSLSFSSSNIEVFISFTTGLFIQITFIMHFWPDKTSTFIWLELLMFFVQKSIAPNNLKIAICHNVNEIRRFALIIYDSTSIIYLSIEWFYDSFQLILSSMC